MRLRSPGVKDETSALINLVSTHVELLRFFYNAKKLTCQFLVARVHKQFQRDVRGPVTGGNPFCQFCAPQKKG